MTSETISIPDDLQTIMGRMNDAMISAVHNVGDCSVNLPYWLLAGHKEIVNFTYEFENVRDSFSDKQIAMLSSNIKEYEKGLFGLADRFMKECTCMEGAIEHDINKYVGDEITEPVPAKFPWEK